MKVKILLVEDDQSLGKSETELGHLDYHPFGVLGYHHPPFDQF